MGLDIHIGSKLQQYLRGGSSEVNDGKHQGCSPFEILGIYVCALVE
jgi:hypothetical protein